MNTATALREGATRAARATNGTLEVLDAIRADIGSLVRSGGKDNEDCERVAIGTLAELRRLTWNQSCKLWAKYTTYPKP